jgi:nickel transport protein
MKLSNFFYIGLLLMLLVLFKAEPVMAHKVNIFAWIEQDTVYTESKFSGGRKARGGRVEVFNSTGKKLLEGFTDDKGAFSFKAPVKDQMKIVLTAGSGHRNEWIINKDEFIDEGNENFSDSNSASDLTEKKISEPLRHALPSPCYTEKDLENIFEDVLDKKLHPLIKQVNQYLHEEKGPTLNDILGGIGYIFGLVGVGVYFNYRNKSRS